MNIVPPNSLAENKLDFESSLLSQVREVALQPYYLVLLAKHVDRAQLRIHDYGS